MSQREKPSADLSKALRSEADRALADRVFQRSPVQSRLLRFLVELAMEGAPPPTQFQIAVDGLGKSPDFDLVNDSYPRVQISRLRSNLENFYARCPREDGAQLVLKPGQYRIILEQPVPVVPPRPAGLSEEQSAKQVQEPYAFVWKAPVAAPRRLLLAALLVLFASAGALTADFFVVEPPADNGERKVDHVKMERPRIVVDASTRALKSDDDNERVIVQSAMQAAENQLAYSMISTTSFADIKPERGDYRLVINFTRDAGSALIVATVILADDEGETLFSEKLAADPANPSDFNRQIEATIITITAPRGVIARDKLSDTPLAPANSYQCFLRIEDRQTSGLPYKKLLDHCIALFPDSNYAPYWYSRRADERYQVRAQTGAISKSGNAWKDVSTAMKIAPFNPIATYVAAKVELAKGNCEAAKPLMELTFVTGSSHPPLIAALELAATPCLELDPSIIRNRRYIREFYFDHHPDPGPMLQIYLMLAALAQNQTEEANKLAQREMNYSDDMYGASVAPLLIRAIGDPAFAQQNLRELDRVLRPYIWNPQTRSEVLQNLTSSQTG